MQQNINNKAKPLLCPCQEGFALVVKQADLNSTGVIDPDAVGAISLSPNEEARAWETAVWEGCG